MIESDSNSRVVPVQKPEGKRFLRYCVRCVMPDTKPDLFLDAEGVCNACRSFEQREEIDWDLRTVEFKKILERYRNKKKGYWDCIIPVSGGKDSTYQVLRLLEAGMNPLCVTARTCDLSDLGYRNIENLRHLGVDHIHFSPNPLVRHKLNRLGLQQVGDISWPEHISIFTIPVRVAVQYQVPLIIWGENSQNEYGGPASAAENNVLDRRWLEEFGGLLGMRISDLVGEEGLTEKDLAAYTYPTDEELKKVGVTGLFLGYYFPWDGMHNALIAKENGFETYPKAVEGAMNDYENLDNWFHGIHDYFKFLKFGFGRATDHACMHIRRGRLTRREGLRVVEEGDGKFPHSYLGKTLDQMLEPLNLTVDEFEKICDRFTNKKIFITDDYGQLTRDKKRNLRKINKDNLSQ